MCMWAGRRLVLMMRVCVRLVGIRSRLQRLESMSMHCLLRRARERGRERMGMHCLLRRARERGRQCGLSSGQGLTQCLA